MPVKLLPCVLGIFLRAFWTFAGVLVRDTLCARKTFLQELFLLEKKPFESLFLGVRHGAGIFALDSKLISFGLPGLLGVSIWREGFRSNASSRFLIASSTMVRFFFPDHKGVWVFGFPNFLRGFGVRLAFGLPFLAGVGLLWIL